ncbi:MAG: glycogen synthase [Bacilli bacterium]
MKVLMVSAETNPLFKCGGLADVVYSLSKKIVTYKQRVIVLTPFYKKVIRNFNEDNAEVFFQTNITFKNQLISVNYIKYVYDGIEFWLIENDEYFSREKIYGYEDDDERFLFFALASAALISKKHVSFDIIHLHDWHTGLIPGILFHEMIVPKFIYTIHNPLFKGYISKDKIKYYYGDLDLPNKIINCDGYISMLETGIIMSSKITTVSPNHAIELLREPRYGLKETLSNRGKDFFGILNGIDVKEFNPHKDSYIFHNYCVENVLCYKKENKFKLCEKFNIGHPEYPLYGIVSRLTYQKGIDLILDSIEELVKLNCNFIFLGVGDKELESKLKAYEDKYPKNIKVIFSYSDEIAHQIYASSDFFLMPSSYEPCGIGQMIALRYGSIPIVREVGGLKDTIKSFNGLNEDVATGLSFYSYTKEALINTVKYSLELFSNKRIFAKIIHNAMHEDNSWTKSYREYLSLYNDAILNK